MHKGTIIAELIAAERAEEHAREADQDARTSSAVCAHHQTTSSTRLLGWRKWPQQLRYREPPAVRRQSFWVGTPEIYFSKQIDNSRLVKVEDPRRGHEMRQFGIALSCLFLLVMTYAWQHFKAIEYGYKIESMKIEADSMIEMNRAQRPEDASCAIPSAST
jgi:hypothetical protein